jgi:hypothetical protein
MFLHHLHEHNDVTQKSDNKVGERYLMSIDKNGMSVASTRTPFYCKRWAFGWHPQLRPRSTMTCIPRTKQGSGVAARTVCPEDKMWCVTPRNAWGSSFVRWINLDSSLIGAFLVFLTIGAAISLHVRRSLVDERIVYSGSFDATTSSLKKVSRCSLLV